MPTLTLTDAHSHRLQADALVLGATRVDGEPALATGHGLPAKTAAHLRKALTAVGATGRPEDVHVLVAVPGVTARTVVLTGLGDATARQTTFDPEVLRRAAGAALRRLKDKESVAVALPAASDAALAAVAEGAYAGCYTFRKLGGGSERAAKASKTGKKAAAKKAASTADPVAPRPDDEGPAITVVGSGDAAVVRRAAVLGAVTDYARDLVNTPPNILFPQSFVESVRARIDATKARVTLEVLDEAALAKGGFGGTVGVGQGSVHPPRIAVMSYEPRGAKAWISLVGKGITFDSGGLCIKPASSMLTMKCDMAGAAAVAATVLAAALLRVKVAVTGYLCLAENLPGANAQRPSDVVTMRNGTTVEIINTDAEGRMVLGDGLSLASEATPDAILDIATLTGAQMVALGNRVAGVMANDDAIRDRVIASAGLAGEAAWPMPLPEDLRPGLDSTTADLKHKSDRWGGMLVAGLFLREFVADGIPWAHLDVAGPAFNEGKPHGHTPKGGTGYGVATMLTFIEGHAS